MRRVYGRYDISGAYPLELGFLTLLQIAGGFVVFEDHKWVTNWSAVAGGVASIIIGLVVVARNSARPGETQK